VLKLKTGDTISVSEKSDQKNKKAGKFIAVSKKSTAPNTPNYFYYYSNGKVESSPYTGLIDINQFEESTEGITDLKKKINSTSEISFKAKTDFARSKYQSNSICFFEKC